MKRFHVSVSVADLGKSIDFYETLFGQPPTVQKPDYAKWMLDDPRINFSLNLSTRASGVNHVGLQADTAAELGEIRERLAKAGANTFEQPEAECCYARSTKTWVRDPDAVAWETFVTHDDLPYHGNEFADGETRGKRCCA